MTTESQSQLPDKKRLETPERVWIDKMLHNHDFASGRGSSVYFLEPDNDADCVEYVRADLLQQPASSERCVDNGGEHDWYNGGDVLRCHNCTATESATPPTDLAEGEPQMTLAGQMRTMVFTACPVCGSEVSHDVFAHADTYRCMNQPCGWGAVYSMGAEARAELDQHLAASVPAPTAPTAPQDDYCNCLTPLGSKTCHHCKKQVRPSTTTEPAAATCTNCDSSNWQRKLVLVTEMECGECGYRECVKSQPVEPGGAEAAALAVAAHLNRTTPAPVSYWQLTTNGNDPLPTDTKYTSFEEIERAIIAAKRDLVEKVLAAIDGERLHENLDNESDIGYQQAVDDVRAAVERVLQGAGITLASTQKDKVK